MLSERKKKLIEGSMGLEQTLGKASYSRYMSTKFNSCKIKKKKRMAVNQSKQIFGRQFSPIGGLINQGCLSI